MSLPKDPIMLLSYVNTQLRDNFSSLDDFVRCQDVDKNTLVEKLSAVNYTYDEKTNQFK